jgi:hypothetical protein
VTHLGHWCKNAGQANKKPMALKCLSRSRRTVLSFLGRIFPALYLLGSDILVLDVVLSGHLPSSASPISELGPESVFAMP